MFTVSAVPEDRDDDREADGRFGRGHRHDEEHEDLPVDPELLRDNATNVRFTALSISSTHMKIMIALRRNITPATPIANRIARHDQRGSEDASELPLGEHDGADDRDEQQDDRDLEGHQVLR